MKYAGANPSDYFYTLGIYGIKKPLPSGVGFEGTGVITQVKNEKFSHLIGKNVACFSNDLLSYGTWA